MFDVVRSPWMISALCIFAISVPIIDMRVSAPLGQTSSAKSAAVNAEILALSDPILLERFVFLHWDVVLRVLGVVFCLYFAFCASS